MEGERMNTELTVIQGGELSAHRGVTPDLYARFISYLDANHVLIGDQRH